ncbi:hypothetical protein [Rhizobacter sp. Root1221]|uniref:hypothetical protein n=1 Tax=Rhizobacter sp. Root1221 TaxID=1736433 RepID=UPI0006F58FAA|nr:hypothetical protein [Rhizobacter sp. Root1221]
MHLVESLAIAACVALASPAQARTSWTVCQYDVEAVRIERAPAPALTVRVLRPRGPLPADCPAATGEMTFRPDSEDYQSELPRRQWPRPGQRALLKYRHLDAICKESGPCRIKRYSLLPARTERAALQAP